jgi:SAM-dependent methyltransferase
MINNMGNENLQLIKKTFDKKMKFDVINSQFAIHYIFEDELSVHNLLKNINNNLKKGGYILLTLFDAGRILNVLKGKQSYTSSYIDDSGNRITLFDIVKKFEDTDDINKPGLGIDVFMSWLAEEGKYQREYIVNYDYLIKLFKDNGIELVESEYFRNIYELHRNYFTNIIEHEENLKNKVFYEKVAKFYDLSKGVDRESYKFMNLFRYYIFQKVT